jgi:SprB repeat
MPLVVSTTITPVSFFGNYDGSIVVSSITGASGPYTYLWSDGSTTATRRNLSAGTYSLTVTAVGGMTGTSTSVVSQPAPALRLTTTPVTITAQWPRRTGEKTYKVSYRKIGDLVDVVPYHNTESTYVILRGLASSSSYTVKIYGSTTGNRPTTLLFTEVCSTSVNSVGNFAKAALRVRDKYSIDALTNPLFSEPINADAVINTAFGTGDRVVTTTVVSGKTVKIDPKIVKVGQSAPVIPDDSVLLPFDAAGTDGQTFTLTLSDNTNVSLLYNKVLNTITYAGTIYTSGDTFTLDNQRVTVYAV